MTFHDGISIKLKLYFLRLSVHEGRHQRVYT